MVEAVGIVVVVVLPFAFANEFPKVKSNWSKREFVITFVRTKLCSTLGYGHKKNKSETILFYVL